MNMNQKGFTNIVLTIVVVAIVAVGGYFVFVKKSEPVAQPQTPTNTIKVTDKGNLYSVEIPKDWKVTRSDEARGVSLSSTYIESPDWKLHSRELSDGPYGADFYYDIGASLHIAVSNLTTDEANQQLLIRHGYFDQISKKNIMIDGVSGGYYIDTEPSLAVGQKLATSVIYKGNTYSFEFGYNPKTYPQAETVFINILHSFKFISNTTGENPKPSETEILASLKTNWRTVQLSIPFRPAYHNQAENAGKIWRTPTAVQFIGKNNVLVGFEDDNNAHVAVFNFNGSKFTFSEVFKNQSEFTLSDWQNLVNKYGGSSYSVGTYTTGLIRNKQIVSFPDLTKVPENIFVKNYWEQ